jgi:hypothetical protein
MQIKIKFLTWTVALIIFILLPERSDKANPLLACENTIDFPIISEWININPRFWFTEQDDFDLIDNQLGHSTVSINQTNQLKSIGSAIGDAIIKSNSYVIIVDAEIHADITEALNQFQADLQAEGHSVIVHLWSGDNPEQLRAYLADLYSTATPQLVGAFLIGDLPKAYYRMYYPATSNCIERGPEEFITYEFFQDLDGIFSRENPDDLIHEYAYDSHTGNTDNEIWIGVLPYTWSHSTTVANINHYLSKNHRYRYSLDFPEQGYIKPLRGGAIDTPELYEAQVNFIVNSFYGWHPLTLRGNTGIFVDNSIGDPVNYPDAKYGWEVAMTSNDYDFADINFHGTGSITLSEAFDLIDSIKPLYIWDSTCSLADIENHNSFDINLIYGNNNAILAAGATGFQGGLGTNINGNYRHNMAQDLLKGISFGESYLNHTNADFIECSEEQKEYFGAQFVFLGDPSVMLQEYMCNHEIVIDQSQDSNDYGYWFEEGINRWQEFIPTLDFLSSIEVLIAKYGNPLGNIILSLHLIDGQLIEQVVVNQAEVVGGWNHIIFDKPIPLIPGEKYRIVITADQKRTGPDDTYSWRGLNDSEYDSGCLTDVSGSNPSYDYAFRTYSISPCKPPNSVSGFVHTTDSIGISGVTLSGLPGDPTTDGSGYYNVEVEHGWSGVVAPQKPGYTFSPVNRSYTNVISDQIDQNYVGSINTYTLSGYVHTSDSIGISGVTLSGLPGDPTTDGSGYYNVEVEHGWSGLVTPQKPGYTFSPVNRSYSNVTSDQMEQNFVGYRIYIRYLPLVIK